MRNLSLKMKIWFGFGLILLILAVVGGYAVMQVQNIQQAANDSIADAKARKATLEIRIASERLISATRGYLLEDHPQFQKDFEDATKLGDGKLKELEC